MWTSAVCPAGSTQDHDRGPAMEGQGSDRGRLVDLPRLATPPPTVALQIGGTSRGRFNLAPPTAR